MIKPIVPIDPRGLDEIADALLKGDPASRTSVDDNTKRPSPARVQNPENYIILPGKTHGTYSYADTLITRDRGHLGKNWVQCHETLVAEDSYMPTIRQYMDFLLMLKSGNKVYDGKGNKVDARKISAILDDILAKREPYRGTWLDADFKVENGILHIKYNHKLVGGVLQPQNSEPLESCLMENCYVDIGFVNRQGLPTIKASKEEIYYWKPLEDNNSVAWFVAGAGRAGLGCSGVPQGSGAWLGVRAAKIKG